MAQRVGVLGRVDSARSAQHPDLLSPQALHSLGPQPTVNNGCEAGWLGEMARPFSAELKVKVRKDTVQADSFAAATGQQWPQDRMRVGPGGEGQVEENGNRKKVEGGGQCQARPGGRDHCCFVLGSSRSSFPRGQRGLVL